MREYTVVFKVVKCRYWVKGTKTWLALFLLTNIVSRERLKAKGKEGGQRMRWLDGVTHSMDMSLSNVWEIVKDRKAWYAAIHGVGKSQKWVSYWITTTVSSVHSRLLDKIIVLEIMFVPGKILWSEMPGSTNHSPSSIMAYNIRVSHTVYNIRHC